MSSDSISSPTSTLRRRNGTIADPEAVRDCVHDSTTDDGGAHESGLPTWKAQLDAARAEIAHKVQKQQEQDGWEVPPAGEQEAPEPSGEDSKGRRESVGTEDGDVDDFIAEMLRPGSRTRSFQKGKRADDDEIPASPARAEVPKDEEDAPRVDKDTSESDKICRICFDSEDDELGKLFSPCRCRGTSRYVHTECLAAWRKASQNSASFYRCDSCAFEYKFRRTFAGNLINSRFSVLGLTILTFLLLTWISGYLANSLLSIVESRSSALQGTYFDDLFVQDHILLGEGVRESLSFVTHRLEDSRWSTARKIAQQAHLDEQQLKLDLADAGLWTRVVLHFTKGTALLGLLSVFYTYVAATFVSPLGRTLFRAIRPAGGRRRAGDNSTSISQVLIVIVIAVGVARAVRQVYRGVRWVSRRILSRLEDLVLEVN